MIWALLILTAIFAIPLVNEYNRRVMDDTARGSAPGQFAVLSKGVTHYEWHGPVRGKIAVCVHGLTTPSFVWRGMTRSLALMGFRVLTYDLYGRGYSDRPKGTQDTDFFLTQLNELLAHEEVDGDITLIGYSMGGAICTCYAAANHNRIRQLVLLAPAGLGVVSGRMGNFIAKTRFIGDWLMLALYPHAYRKGLRSERNISTSVPDIGVLQAGELDFKRFVPSVLASIRGFLSRVLTDEHKALHRHGIPVLAIWGENDKVIPQTAIGALAQVSRDAHQEVIDGAGHGLPYTHTDQIIAIFQEALIRD
ncbi:MAG: alpha/beta hydrolase [Sulfitobacter sp.]